MTDISVVIPAYNEEERLEPSIGKISEYLRSSGYVYEIIVVDDGSTDSTVDVAKRAASKDPAVRLVANRSNRGKGYSVKNGFLNSVGRFVLFSDADLSTPIEELGLFMDIMEGGADIVIGSRAMRGSDIIKRQPIYRMLMGKTFNKIVRLFTVRGIKDTQCGFKLFRRGSCMGLFEAQRIERFAFDVELLFLAVRKGLVIREIPVRWINSPQSKVDVVRDSARMLLDIIRLRWDHIRGAYSGYLSD